MRKLSSKEIRIVSYSCDSYSRLGEELTNEIIEVQLLDNDSFKFNVVDKRENTTLTVFVDKKMEDGKFSSIEVTITGDSYEVFSKAMKITRDIVKDRFDEFETAYINYCFKILK